MTKKKFEFYESVLLMKFMNVDKAIYHTELYRSFLKRKGSKVLCKNCGKKNLAYPLQGFERAAAVRIAYTGNASVIRKINAQIQRDKFVLRSITTKLFDSSVRERLTKLT